MKKLQKGARRQLHDQCSDDHDEECHFDGKYQRLLDPLTLARSVIVGKHRDHAVVQSENRHEKEALQLKVGPEYRGCRAGKPHQNQIHQVGHHGADADHQNGRHADIIDFADRFFLRMKNVPQT